MLDICRTYQKLVVCRSEWGSTRFGFRAVESSTCCVDLISCRVNSGKSVIVLEFVY